MRASHPFIAALVRFPIQSDFEAPGLPGNLEVVAVTGGGQMVHLWRDSGPAFAWNISTTIANGVRG